MNLKDGVDFAEDKFGCSMGHPGRCVDMGLQDDFRRYVSMRVTYNLLTSIWGDDGAVLNHLVGCFISEMGRIHARMSSVGIKRPTLYWRYHDKLRFERTDRVSTLSTRLYITSCVNYGIYQCAEPAVTHVKVVQSVPSKELLLLAMMAPVTECD